MAPSHVRVAAWLHVKQLTGVNVGQPLSFEITYPGCRPRCPKGKAILGGVESKAPAGPAESETLSMRGNSMFENRECLGSGPWSSLGF